MAEIEERAPGVEPDPELLARVQERYDEGRYLAALALAEADGARIEEWWGTRAEVLAGRLLRNLGGARQARRRFLRAWRREPDHPQARSYGMQAYESRWGPLLAWRRLCELPPLDPALASPTDVVDDLCQRANVATILRDFQAARLELERVTALASDDPWVWTTWAHYHERSDRLEEALEAVAEARRRQRWFRPAVQGQARLLALASRPEEALAVLDEALPQLESGFVVAQRASLLRELGRLEAAQEAWAEVPRLLPKVDPELAEWLAAARSDVAYLLGDRRGAAELAQQAGEAFRALAERGDEASGTRRRLDVPFVRQHHDLCAPASLVMVSDYWGFPRDQLEVADGIAYDGTPAHSQRRWADEQGWYGRELSVTWEAIVELIDAGVPLALCTVEPTSAHLQVIVGYDSRRRTVLIRDPGFPTVVEGDADKLLERYASSGPRGLLVLPPEQRQRAEARPLPDAELWDVLHELQLLLEAHDREGAGAAAARLRESSPEHWLALEAERILAVYDGDSHRLLGLVEALRERFPDEQRFLLMQLACLEDLDRGLERRALLEDACVKHDAHPALLRWLAAELIDEGRELGRARRLLRRALAKDPLDAAHPYTLAKLEWLERRSEQAFLAFRLAACLRDKDERYALAFFRAARALGRGEQVVAFLRDRWEEFGGRSPLPAQTLSLCLALASRDDEGLAVLDEAVARHPEDGGLLLFAADSWARTGGLERAAELIEQARGRAPQSRVLRTEAELAYWRGELARALELWQQVLAAEPWSLEAVSASAELLESLEGRQPALELIAQAAATYPHSRRLRQLQLRWLGADAADRPDETEAAIRSFVADFPADGWAWRELALHLAGRERHAEAAEAAAQDPDDPGLHPGVSVVRGRLLELKGDLAGSAAAYRAALDLELDNPPAIEGLLNAAEDDAARHEVWRFVMNELIRRPHQGLGLLQAQQVLGGWAPAEEHLGLLKDLHARHQDLWAAYHVVAEQLMRVDKAGEAFSYAEQACRRFPLEVRVWLLRAWVAQVVGDAEAELASLGRARELEPSSPRTAQRLAEFRARHGDLEQARDVLTRALTHTPRAGELHADLAGILLRLGRPAEALETAERAVLLEPEHDGCWGRLLEVEAMTGGGGRALELARGHTARRPADIEGWLRLARLLPDEALEERLAALERAEALRPRDTEIHDQRAQLLAQAGRWDEAQEACRPAVFGESVPHNLLGRAAWIKAAEGDLPGAAAAMREIVAIHRGYTWGWQELSEWLRSLEDVEGHREAAETLTEVDPGSALSWAHLGSALTLSGERERARQAYQRAVRLDREFAFPAGALAELLREDGELEEALAVLEPALTHAPTALNCLRAVELAAELGRRPQAAAAWEVLLRQPDAPEGMLSYGASRFAERGWRLSAGRRVRAAIDDPRAHPEVGRLWALSLARINAWRELERRLPELLEQGRIGELALEGTLEALGGLGAKAELDRLLESQLERIRADDELWGSAAGALLGLGDLSRVRSWQADWRDRRDAPAWALDPLCEALLGEGDYEQLGEVSRWALQKEPDGSRPAHLVRATASQALAGGLADPAALAEVDLLEIRPDLSCLGLVALGLLEQEVGGLEAARHRLSQARSRVPNWSEQLHLRQALQRARALAAERAGAMGWLWHRVLLPCWLLLQVVFSLEERELTPLPEPERPALELERQS